MTEQTNLKKRIRTKKQLQEQVYYHLVKDPAIKTMIPIGTRDLVVTTANNKEYRIRISKVKRSGRAQ